MEREYEIPEHYLREMKKLKEPRMTIDLRRGQSIIETGVDREALGHLWARISDDLKIVRKSVRASPRGGAWITAEPAEEK